MTRDVVIADHEPFDVDTLDIFSVRCEREREFSVKPRRLHLDLTQPCDLLIQEIEYESAASRHIGGFVPTYLGNGQVRRAKVEPGLGLGASCIKDRIGQIDANRSDDPVG